MRWSTAAVMPSALAATTIGSPQGSRVMRSASSRLMPSACSSMRPNSPGLRCSAAVSRRRITSLAAGAGRRAAARPPHRDWSGSGGVLRCWPQRTVRPGRVWRSAWPWSRAGAGVAGCAARRAKLAEDRAPARPVGRQSCRDRGAGRRVDGVDQPQCQLDILGFFLGAVGRLLHIEVGEDAQQRRADVDAVPACQIDQTVERGVRGGLHHDGYALRNYDVAH